MQYALIGEKTCCAFEVLVTANTKADVVEAYSIFVKLVSRDGMVRGWPQRQEHCAVTEEYFGLHSGHLL